MQINKGLKQIHRLSSTVTKDYKPRRISKLARTVTAGTTGDTITYIGYISGASLFLFPFLAHPDTCRFGKVDGNKRPDCTNNPIDRHPYSVFFPVSPKIEPAPSWGLH
jgi:hypothetical protein